MATNVFVYWSDGLGGAGHFTVVVGERERAICQRKLPAGPGHLTNFFKCPEFTREDARGWN